MKNFYFPNSMNSKAQLMSIVILCVGILLGCSGGDVGSPDWNVHFGGFGSGDTDFTVVKILEDDFPVANHIRVHVEAITGEVVITGQQDAKRVMVTARLSVRSDSRKDAESHLDDLEILVTDGTNEILIETVQPENFNGRTYRVEYDITVPDSFEVEVSQVSGTIAILDIQNSVEVSNKNGDVLLPGIVGGVVADVDNGGIEGTVILPVNEAIDLFVKNGGLELSIPTSTSAEFSAAVIGNGEIRVSDLELSDSSSTAKSLSGTLGDGEGSIALRTVNGNIEVIGFD